jgi:hypothetical protein
MSRRSNTKPHRTGRLSPDPAPGTRVRGDEQPAITPEDFDLPIGDEGRPDPFKKGWLLYFDITTNPSFIVLYDGKNLTHLFDEYELEGDVLWLHLPDGRSLWTFVNPLREEPGQAYNSWWQPVLRSLAERATP